MLAIFDSIDLYLEEKLIYLKVFVTWLIILAPISNYNFPLLKCILPNNKK